MAAFKGKETTVPTKKLFCPVRVGPLTLSHRVVMAPSYETTVESSW